MLLHRPTSHDKGSQTGHSLIPVKFRLAEQPTSQSLADFYLITFWVSLKTPTKRDEDHFGIYIEVHGFDYWGIVIGLEGISKVFY